ALRGGERAPAARGCAAGARRAARARAPGDRAALRALRLGAADAGGSGADLRRHPRADPPDRDQHAEEAARLARGADAARSQLARLEHDHRGLAGELLLVIVEAGVLLVVLAPEPLALLARGDAGKDRVALATALDFALRIGLQVERPGWDLGVAGVGVDHDHVLAVGEVDDRRGALLSGLASRRGQQQDRRA